MPVEDVFSISVVARGDGRIERGIVKVRRSGDCGTEGDGEDDCTGVEMFRKLLDEGQAGDKSEYAARHEGEDVEAQVLAKPGDQPQRV